MQAPPDRIGLFSFVVRHYKIAFVVVLILELLGLVLSAMFARNNTLIPKDFKQVPADLKEDKTYLRQLAYLERRMDNNLITPEDRKIRRLPSSHAIDDLSVIYRADNVLTKQHLLAIRQVEDWMTHVAIWPLYALTDKNGTVLKPRSILRFFDGTYGGEFNDWKLDNIPQTLHRAVTNDTLKATLEQFIATDATISPTEAKSTLTRSVFTIGLPRTTEFDPETFWKSNFGDQLTDLAKNGRAGMRVYFFTMSIFQTDLIDQVETDLQLALGSCVFIVLFVLLQTQSVFITLTGIASILFSFVWANYIYRVLLDYRYFGIFHALSVFIILGIGADDLFVFYDTWRTTDFMGLRTVEQRFTFCYKHAALSMLITSLTTAVAFASNVFTPLYGISSFAVFTAVLVMVNYLSAILFFPLCVLVYHKHMEQWPWPWQILFPPPTKKAPKRKRPNFIVRFFRGPLYRCVTHKVAIWVFILGSTQLALVFGFIADHLEISERNIQYYKDGNNYQEALHYNRYGFKRGLRDFNIKIYILFGLKEPDLSGCQSYDYNCEGETVYDDDLDLNPIPAQLALLRTCHHLKNLLRHEDLHIARDEKTNQVKVTCFLDNMNQFFQSHGSDSSVFNSSVNLLLPVSGIKYLPVVGAQPGMYGPDIVSGDFYRFFETAVSYWLSNAYRGDQATGDNYTDDVHLADLLGLSSVSSDLAPVFFNSSDVYGAKLRYFIIEVETSLVFGLTDFKTGLAAYEAWEKFTTGLMSELPATVQGFQLASHKAWHTFKQSEALQSSAIRGIVLGSVLSFCVLTVATYNVLISLLATINILFVIATFSGCIKIFGYKISVIESVNLSLVGGLSVDYVVHFSESYHLAPYNDRLRRVREMMGLMGISVLSGALTTAGAALFMLRAEIFFFFQFGIFILLTILFSLFYCLFWFTPVMALIGPEGNVGSLVPVFRWIQRALQPVKAELSAVDEEERMSF